MTGPVRYRAEQLARLLGLPPPTPEQAAVIEAPLQPLAVIAGAGSGKSETMAGRLVWLVANGQVRPERALGLTFTRKAAAELGQRVRARLDGLRRAGLAVSGGGAAESGAGAVGADAVGGNGVGAEGMGAEGEPTVSTYHSYAARLVSDHALREALEPSLRLITPAVCWQLAAGVVAAYGGPMDDVAWGPAEVTAAVLDLAGEMAEHLRAPADVSRVGEWLRAKTGELDRVPARVRAVLACQRTREQLLPLVIGYAQAKAAREVIDHGDQVAIAARIASRHPEVGAAERARYELVLLDEYQDTSYAQLVLLRALFGGGHPVTAVGDECQSIYGWRGASAGNLRRFRWDFPVTGQAFAAEDGSGPARAGGSRAARSASEPAPPRAAPADVKSLSTSFRNAGRVLDVAAVLQQGLPDRGRDLPALAPAPGRAARGAVSCALLETAADEAGWIADRIGELLAQAPGIAPDGEAWPAGGPERIRPADVAVLCRKRAQFPALRAALEARGIPVEVVGLGGLLTVPEVADVVATLRVLHDPDASASLARLLTGPRWRIGPADLVALGRRARALAHPGPPPGTSVPGGQPGDPLAQAVTDVTTPAGSLVEALEDLGDLDAYSADGRARFTALTAELRSLRAHTGRPLPDLVGEVERVLGLDVEVASQPWRDPDTARADLDAFVDEAAAFADDQQEPTLGAFLAFLAAAETEEFGLESGRRSGTDAVTLMTVHAAKGLEWPAVFVPGLSCGLRAQVFPARPRVTTRWTDNPRLLPFGLRGDAGDLPRLPDLAPDSLANFTDECTAREDAEERRLAYVAVTRAAFFLACTGYWWGDGASLLGPSVFLREVREACLGGAGRVAHWEAEPGDGEGNPALVKAATAAWPLSPGGPRYEAVREAAAMVGRAISGGAAAGTAAHAGAREAGAAADGAAAADGGTAADGAAAGAGGAAAAGPLTPEERALAQAWSEDVGLLLAELAEQRSGSGLAVALPARLPVSALVTMAGDPADLARQIRRPMPRPPAPAARRGTAFHRWLEERFGQPRLLDPADLLGAADDTADDGDVADLALLRERFEEGEWGTRWPEEVEVPFETEIAGRAVRGRIDAVFRDPRGGYDVVDWKTGSPPGSEPERRAAAVQLAAYRLAWARLAGVPLSQVRAAFYYVRDDRTVRPADLLDEAGLTALIEAVPAAG